MKFVYILVAFAIIAMIGHSGFHIVLKAYHADQRARAQAKVESTNFKFGCLSRECERCRENLIENPTQISFFGNSAQKHALDLDKIEAVTTRPLQMCFKGGSTMKYWIKFFGTELPKNPQQTFIFGYLLMDIITAYEQVGVIRHLSRTDDFLDLLRGIQYNYRHRLAHLDLPAIFTTGFRGGQDAIDTVTNIIRRRKFPIKKEWVTNLLPPTESRAMVRALFESIGTTARLYIFRSPEEESLIYTDVPKHRLEQAEKMLAGLADEFPNVTLIDVNREKCGIGASDFWDPKLFEYKAVHANDDAQRKFTNCLIGEIRKHGIFE